MRGQSVKYGRLPIKQESDIDDGTAFWVPGISIIKDSYLFKRVWLLFYDLVPSQNSSVSSTLLHNLLRLWSLSILVFSGVPLYNNETTSGGTEFLSCSSASQVQSKQQ